MSHLIHTRLSTLHNFLSKMGYHQEASLILKIAVQQISEDTIRKTILKILKAQLFEKGVDREILTNLTPDNLGEYSQEYQTILNNFNNSIPNDVEPEEKELIKAWILNLWKANKLLPSDPNFPAKTKNLTENFFQTKEFATIKDLNQIQSLEQLKGIIDEARPFYQNKQRELLAKSTEEPLYDSIYKEGEWEIFIPWNKQGAAELGLETDWCTADLESNYFENYHRSNDPLFIFYKNNEPIYQFHFGSDQFMDTEDSPLPEDDVKFGLSLLKKISNSLVNNLTKKRETYIGLKRKGGLATQEEIEDYLLKYYKGGDLILNGFPIKKLPDFIKNVDGHLNLSETQITELPTGLEVDGYLRLRNTPITELPDNLKVGGSLFLSFTQITELPVGLKVGGSLDLFSSKIKKLPDDIKVDGILNLSLTPITELPDNLKVGSSLVLSNTQITKLPVGLNVGDNLYLSNTPITELPADLKVGSDLYLKNTAIKSMAQIPPTVQIVGEIIF